MNATVQAGREAALQVLQPNQRDLDHGFELHAASLVCDAYGFAPQCAADGDALSAAVEAGGSPTALKDLAERTRATRAARDAAQREEWLDAWQAAGVTCILQNAGEEHNSPLVLIKRLSYFTYATDRLRDHVARAVSPDDIECAQAERRHCLYFSANAVPYTFAEETVADALRYIQVWFDLGVRMMHLTYNRRNLIGEGCGEAANAGLSDFGRAAIAEMNRCGVIVDVAHSGWRTSLEAAQASTRPMVASHSGAAALNGHYRCKPDEVIRAVAETDGYVGICWISRFLGGDGSLNAVLDHIDYVVRLVGVQHVAVGTDVAYRSPLERDEQKKVPPHPAVGRWETLWPEPEAVTGIKTAGRIPEHPSLAWTNWPLLTVGLVQRGYSDDDVAAILGGNVMRVARANWEAVA